MTRLIDAARALAEEAHRNQVRKYTGEPYIVHPARVAAMLPVLCPTATAEMAAAAWLHDVVEDCGVDRVEIFNKFGPLVQVLVDDLTKPNTVHTVSGQIIKACDLIDNLGNIAEVAPPAEALAYLRKKGPQAIQIIDDLKDGWPLLAATLGQTWLRNWHQARERISLKVDKLT